MNNALKMRATNFFHSATPNDLPALAAGGPVMGGGEEDKRR